MKIYIDKDYFGIHGSMPNDREAIDNLKPGMYQCEIKRPRNVRHHRKFFGLLNLAYSMQETYVTMDSFRDAVTIKAGYYDAMQVEIPQLGKVMVCKPHSISFASMSQPDFEVFYDRVLGVLIRHFCPGTTEQEMEDTVLKYLSFGG